MRTLFVYGLLKPGLRYHHLLAPFAQRHADGSVRGRLYDAGVPAARFDRDGTIDGVVFWLDPDRLDEALRILDDLEDEGEQYRRVVVEVRTDQGVVEAQAYEYLGDVDALRDVGERW